MLLRPRTRLEKRLRALAISDRLSSGRQRTTTGAEIVDLELISALDRYEVLSRGCVRSLIDADPSADRLLSALRSGVRKERVTDGDPENWAAVARAISDRIRELGWRQRELAERSHVSIAVVREIQRHTVERRRSRRTLEALSVALGWEPERLEWVLKGLKDQPQRGPYTVPDSAALWSRLDSMERRLDEISKLLTELKADVATVAGHIRDDY